MLRAEELLVALGALSLALIVALPTKLKPSVVDGLVEIQALGQELGGREKDAQVVQIRVDRVSDTRELDLDGDSVAVLEDRLVHQTPQQWASPQTR